MLRGRTCGGEIHRQPAGPDEENEILTAEEIAALDLSGVEWAVLSACDTGLGEVKAGEGVLGLRRAFEVAGERTVMMRLWPVGDQGGREGVRTMVWARLCLGRSSIDALSQVTM